MFGIFNDRMGNFGSNKWSIISLLGQSVDRSNQKGMRAEQI